MSQHLSKPEPGFNTEILQMAQRTDGILLLVYAVRRGGFG
jgi:hypothetical protein